METAIYCKARGMPFDHVDGNAILTFCGNCDGKIHGAEMECSYPGCRSQGPKFRYCGFCKSAVSKRNFRKRHAHGMLFSSTQGSRTPQTFATPFDPESVQTAVERKRIRIDTNECLQLVSSAQLSSQGNLMTSSRSHIFSAPSPIKVGGITGNGSIATYTRNFQNDQINDVPEDWTRLYHNRPRIGDLDGIRSWVSLALNIAGLRPQTPSSNPAKTGDSAAHCWFCEEPDLIDHATAKNDLTNISLFTNCSPASFPICKPTTPLNITEELNSSILSNRCLPKYKMFADSLSLHVETDGIGIGNLSDDVLPLDSEGSIFRV